MLPCKYALSQGRYDILCLAHEQLSEETPVTKIYIPNAGVLLPLTVQRRAWVWEGKLGVNVSVSGCLSFCVGL